MQKRLQLAYSMLSRQGVVFISIDDNEFAQLKMLCDDIFGMENFISILSIENNPKGRKNSSFISISNEFCLIYAKEKESTFFVENIPKNVKDVQQDENGDFVHNSGKRVLVGENKFNKYVDDFESDKHYSIYYRKEIDDMIIKKEKEINEKDEVLINQGYERYISFLENKFVLNTYSKSRITELYKQHALEFKNGKIYEKNFSTTIRLKSMVVNREYIGIVDNSEKNVKIDVKTTSAGGELKDLFNAKELPFSNPKNVQCH